MSLILAIEPERAQAEVLQQTVLSRADADLVVVPSTEAAIREVDRRVPDLLLVGRSVSPAEQETVVVHTKTRRGFPNLPTMAIPNLLVAKEERRSSLFGFKKPARAEGQDPNLFAELAICVADAEARRRAEAGLSSIGLTAVPDAGGPPEPAPPPPALTTVEFVEADEEPSAIELPEPLDHRMVSSGSETRVAVAPPPSSADADALRALIVQAQAQAEARLAEGIDRIRDEATQQRLRDLATLERQAVASQDAAVREARIAADAIVREVVSTELATLRLETDAKLASELSRSRSEVERVLGDSATQALKNEAERVRAESEARFEAERRRFIEVIDRMRREAAEQRAKDLAVLESTAAASREAVLDVTRAAADTQAAWAAELTRVRTEAERQLASDLGRVRLEAEARFETELRQILEKAEHAWLAQERARHDTDAIRDQAARAARTAAEEAAAHQLEVEVGRIRAEADARLEAELGRFRAEAEQARVARDHAQREIDALRERAERQARSAAEAAAGRILEAEVAKVRSETEERVRAALALMQEQVNLARADRQSMPGPAETVPEQPAEEARNWRAPLAAAAATALAAVAVFAMGLPGALWNRTADVEPPAITEPLPQVEEKPAPAASTPTRRRAEEKPAPKPVEAVPPPTGGFLALSTRIPLELYLGDQHIGTTQDGQIPVATGQQTIRMVSERFNFSGELPIEIRPGALTSLTYALPLASIRVEAPPGAEIWIDNELVGSSPLPAIGVPIGNHEVMVKHQDLGERRQSVDVKFGETTELRVD
jgi:hypothetical protein